MSEFDLIYIRKSDNRIFHAKRIIAGVYKIQDPMLPNEAKTITKYELKRDYEYQSKVSNENVKRRTQPIVLKLA